MSLLSSLPSTSPLSILRVHDDNTQTGVPVSVVDVSFGDVTVDFWDFASREVPRWWTLSIDWTHLCRRSFQFKNFS
jgi:hypothetical protein